ncbi:hypothetical protein BJX70DRAFT_376584 [Aspergillus crustosus]
MSASILITGGTSGLGYHAAINLARQFPNHQIIIASRTNTNNASDRINRHLKQQNVSFMPLDLSSFTQVRAFVTEWTKESHPPIEYLLLNAGIQVAGPVKHTEDGFERTFAINHLSQALLFSLLTPYLTHDARIVLTGSGTHDPSQPWPVPPAKYTSAEDLADAKKVKDSQECYSNSKLITLMWSYALERRLKPLRESGQCNWTVASICPGMVPGTNLARNLGPVVACLFRVILPRCLPLLRIAVGSKNIYTPEYSGESIAFVAGAEEVRGVSGEYFEGRAVVKSSGESYEEVKQEELWEFTVKSIARGEEEVKRFGLGELGV